MPFFSRRKSKWGNPAAFDLVFLPEDRMEEAESLANSRETSRLNVIHGADLRRPCLAVVVRLLGNLFGGITHLATMPHAHMQIHHPTQQTPGRESAKRVQEDWTEGTQGRCHALHPLLHLRPRETLGPELGENAYGNFDLTWLESRDPLLKGALFVKVSPEPPATVLPSFAWFSKASSRLQKPSTLSTIFTPKAEASLAISSTWSILPANLPSTVPSMSSMHFAMVLVVAGQVPDGRLRLNAPLALHPCASH